VNARFAQGIAILGALFVGQSAMAQANVPDPIARLSVPLLMATGTNWLSWKMAHSRRWYKLSPIPQLLAVRGNVNGFHTNLH
jgi:hypothetical protein